MASMATVSLEEKRLKALKQQLFGKSISTPSKVTGRQFKDAMNSHQATVAAVTLESVNLKSDLMKIIILSFFAIAIQFSLFFANQNGLIKLFN